MPLSKTDVERLITDDSAETRAATVAKIAGVFEKGQISDKEKGIAEEIFRLMMQDAAVRVRSALSESLKHCPHLPHDVAASLANDVNDVALPMLEFSEALSDEDLVAIIGGDDSTKQTAIANRSTVSTDVADALVDSHNEDVVAVLMSNDGADISEGTFDRILDEFSTSDKIKTPMVHRRRMPAKVAERLVAMVSDHLREHVVAHHELPAGLASDLIMQSRERATMSLSAADNAEELARTLAENNRLTPSIITRALCMGDLPFFEHALAILAKMAIKNVRTLVHDKGSLGLKAVFERAGLPAAMWPIARAAIDIAQELEYDGDDHDRERYTKRMIERVVTHFEDPGKDIDEDNLRYLLNKLTDLTRLTPRAA